MIPRLAIIGLAFSAFTAAKPQETVDTIIGEPEPAGHDETHHYIISMMDKFKMDEYRPSVVLTMLYEELGMFSEGSSSELNDLNLAGEGEEEHDHEGHDHEGHDHGSETASATEAEHNHEDHEGEHDDHEGHNHTKRQEPNELAQLCATPEELLSMLDIENEGNLSDEDIEALAPGLLWMATNQQCVNQLVESSPLVDDDHADESRSERLPIGLVWLYTMIANLIVSLMSLGGLFVMPLVRRSKTAEFITLNGLMSLAVGALLGDSLLHLLPEVFIGADELAGGHDHSAEGGAHDHTGTVGYSMLAILGAYIFFVLEDLPSVLPSFITSKLFGLLGSHTHDRSPGPDEGGSMADFSYLEDETHKRTMQLAVMVLISDSIHNIMDGLAIGSAFGISWQLGVSTTIAVALHELPHEFADFAVLLKAGIRPLRAAIFNFISSLTALMGGAIAVGTGAVSPGFTIGTLAFVAGNFLYLALNGILVHLQNSAYLSEEEEMQLRDANQDGTSERGVESGFYENEKDQPMPSTSQPKPKTPLYLSKYVRMAIVHTGVVVGVIAMLLIALFGESITVG